MVLCVLQLAIVLFIYAAWKALSAPRII